MSLEVICLLLAMKIRYPNHIYLIRGNHETREMAEIYGFAGECTSKTTHQIFGEFCDMFAYLPIAAVISSRILCIHGGITPTLSNLDQIRTLVRPADASVKGFLADLLWSDPSTEVDDWGPSERGDTVFWNLGPVKRFLEANGLAVLIRAHQMVDTGFEYPFEPDRCVVTVFSAPCYAGEYRNRGAYLDVEKDLMITPVLLPHEPRSMAFAHQSGRAETPKFGGRGKKGKDKKRGGKGKYRK
jgi:serine/threonine-protein phosphatase PP1 catalytic subunit